MNQSLICSQAELTRHLYRVAVGCMTALALVVRNLHRVKIFVMQMTILTYVETHPVGLCMIAELCNLRSFCFVCSFAVVHRFFKDIIS